MKSTLTEAVSNFPNGLILIENEINQPVNEMGRSNGSSVISQDVLFLAQREAKRIRESQKSQKPEKPPIPAIQILSPRAGPQTRPMTAPANQRALKAPKPRAQSATLKVSGHFISKSVHLELLKFSTPNTFLFTVGYA